MKKPMWIKIYQGILIIVMLMIISYCFYYDFKVLGIFAVMIFTGTIIIESKLFEKIKED